MLPNKAFKNPETCLSSLVGIQADCGGPEAYMYVENIEGCDIKKLSEIANVQNPSGKSFAQAMIDAAAREMLGDIELITNNGFVLKQTFGDLCGACDYATSGTIYSNGGGVKIQNMISSPYSVLKVFSVEIAANYTGDAVLVLDDGTTPQSFDITLEAGIADIHKLEYSTTKKVVKVYIQGNATPVARIDCPTVRSCGCGGSSNRDAADTIRYSGLLNGIDVSTQYGFKICASVTCDSGIMTCDLVNAAPRTYSLALLYKVGSKYYSEASLSERNNRTAGMDEDKKEGMVLYYNNLYKQLMYGKTFATGVNVSGTNTINNNIQAYLRQKKDRCVTCESIRKESYVTG